MERVITPQQNYDGLSVKKRWMKQLKPEKTRSKLLEFYLHRSKSTWKPSNYELCMCKIKRRRPYDKCFEKTRNENKVEIQKKQNRNGNNKEARPSIDMVVKKLFENANKIKNSILSSKSTHDTFHSFVSPRKRILKELEKVSLEDIASMSKRSRAKGSISSDTFPAKSSLSPAKDFRLSPLSSSKQQEPTTTRKDASDYNLTTKNSSESTTTTSNSRISSYSITSLLSHNCGYKKESPSTSQYNLTKYTKPYGSIPSALGDSMQMPSSENSKVQQNLSSFSPQNYTKVASSFDDQLTTEAQQRVYSNSLGARVPNNSQPVFLTSDSFISRDYFTKYRNDLSANLLHNPYQIPSSSLTDIYFKQPSEKLLASPYTLPHNGRNSFSLRNNYGNISQLEESNLYYISNNKKNTFQNNSSVSGSPIRSNATPHRDDTRCEKSNYIKLQKDLDASPKDNNKLNCNDRHEKGITNPYIKFHHKDTPMGENTSLSEYADPAIASYYQQMYATAAAQAAAHYHQALWFNYPALEPAAAALSVPLTHNEPSSFERYTKQSSQDDCMEG